MRAVLDPLPNLGAALPETLLDVNLLRLVAGESDVDAGERAARQVILPFELVQEIKRVVALAEEQPARTLGAGLDSLLDKSAIGGNARAGTDHDDRTCIVYRQAVMAVRFDVNLGGITHAAAVAEMA